MTLAMTPTAMADLSERARRVLDLQAKMIAYFADAVTDYDGSAMAEGEQPRIPPSCRDMRDMDRFARDSADLIRELLEENERLQAQINAVTSTIAVDDSLYRGNSVRYWYDKLTARTAHNDQLRARIQELEAWRRQAFDVSPNIDADIEALATGVRDAGPTPLRGRVTRRTE